MEKTQEVSVTHLGRTKTFTASNKSACFKSEKHPDGVKYMSDEQFAAHIEDQKRGAMKSIEAEIVREQRLVKDARMEELKGKRRAGTLLNPLEQQEMLDLLAGV